MDGMLRSLRLPAVVFLLFWVLPPRVDAQQFVCRPIAAGDTASGLALRLTGKAEAAYGHAFQVRDPARQMFVPKSHYQRLQSDWQACVAREPVASTPVAYAPVVEVAAWAVVRDEPVGAPPAHAIYSTPLMLTAADRAPSEGSNAVTIGAAIVSIVLLSAVAGSLVPRPIPAAARRAGENFVAVFARPLVDPSSGAPPIESRLRFRRRTQQLEISIAPGPGRRYPNLSDHKKNVEYDVDRVMRILGNYVLSGPPRAAGKWVVLTIEPTQDAAERVARASKGSGLPQAQAAPGSVEVRGRGPRSIT
jgi:hypothetical protein